MKIGLMSISFYWLKYYITLNLAYFITVIVTVNEIQPFKGLKKKN